METLYSLIILALWILLLLMGTLTFALSLSEDWRFSLLKAFTVFGVLVWLSSEVLSIFNLLTFAGLVIFWMVGFLILLIILVRKIKKTPIRLRSGFLLSQKKNINEAIKIISLPLFTIAVICVVLLIFAIQVAPNNWDSMTYHLSRVVHWQQQQSIRFYPTNNLRQLHSGPWAELAILHLQIIVGSDRLSNMVQWFAMVGSLIAVSYIAKLLGGSRMAQVFSTLITVLIPMGILQSTSTQNDYVVALWLCIFCAFSLRIIRDDYNETRFRVLYVFIGISLGLAVLTKPTSIIFALPLIFWLFWTLVRRYGRHFLIPVLTLGTIALIINSGQFTRNYLLFKNPLGPPSESGDASAYKYTNDIFNLSVLTSNLLRNSAIHLAIPSASINEFVNHSILVLHNQLAIDINDPRTTWTGTQFSVAYSRNENLAGNPLHFFLIGLSLILVIRIRKSYILIMGICIIVSCFLFSLILKWQPWNSRLHLPLFVLGAAFSATVLSKSVPRGLNYLIAIILLGASIPYIINNPSKPLIGPHNVYRMDRETQYFIARPDIKKSYDMIANSIDNIKCNDIGLILGGDDWEYPIWILTGSPSANKRIENINITNPSSQFTVDFTPCVIITTISQPEQKMEYNGITYALELDASPLFLFVPLNSYN